MSLPPPSVTKRNDILGYKLPFVKSSAEYVAFSGMPSLGWSFFTQLRDLTGLIFSLEQHPIDIIDAKARKDLDFKDTGFQLLNMKNEITDWDDDKQLEAYKTEVEALLRTMYPSVKKMFWLDFLKRGGKDCNPPATDGPHLDYWQDWDACGDFAGRGRTDEPGLVFGVWRPVMMSNPVLDYPLVYMDKRDYGEEVSVPFRQVFKHITPKGVESAKNLASHVRFKEGQRWYYHSDMTSDECLLFTHYDTEGKGANIHCAVKRGVVGEGQDTRTSIENRVLLFF